MKSHKSLGSKRRFPEKLWEAVNGRSTLLEWADDGKAFIVNSDRFELEVMATYHDLVQIPTFANFRRQLRVYGFQWRSLTDKTYCFSHPNFTSSGAANLSLIHTQRCDSTKLARKRKAEDDVISAAYKQLKTGDRADSRSSTTTVPKTGSLTTWESQIAKAGKVDSPPVSSTYSQPYTPVQYPSYTLPYASIPTPPEDILAKSSQSLRPFLPPGLDGESVYSLPSPYDIPLFPRWDPSGRYIPPSYPPNETAPKPDTDYKETNKNSSSTPSPSESPVMPRPVFPPTLTRCSNHLESLLLSGGGLITPAWDAPYHAYNPLYGEFYSPAPTENSVPSASTPLKPTTYLPSPLGEECPKSPAQYQPLANAELSSNPSANGDRCASQPDCNIAMPTLNTPKKEACIEPYEASSLEAYNQRE